MQHLLQEDFCFIRNILEFHTLIADLSTLDGLDDLLIGLPVERRVPSEENVEDDSTTPYITLLTVDFVLTDHLWR